MSTKTTTAPNALGWVVLLTNRSELGAPILVLGEINHRQNTQARESLSHAIRFDTEEEARDAAENLPRYLLREYVPTVFPL